jgi:hypothetical protein
MLLVRDLVGMCLFPPRLPMRGALLIVRRCNARPGLFLDPGLSLTFLQMLCRLPGDAGDCLFGACKRGRAVTMITMAGRDCASLSVKAADKRGSSGQHLYARQRKPPWEGWELPHRCMSLSRRTMAPQSNAFVFDNNNDEQAY